MTGRSEALSCLGNQTSQGFVDLKLLREAVWTPEGVRHDRRQKAMASLFLWPRKTAQQPKQPVQAWRNTCATSEKRNPHTPHAGRNRFSSQKISMSSHFIMHSIAEGAAWKSPCTKGGPPGKALTLTLPAVILQLLLWLLSPRRLNFNPQPTRQKSKDCLVSGNRLKEQKALNL